VPGGRLTGSQLGVLAELAVGSGDGHAELTSRGNVQLRGLPDDVGPALAEALAGAGLLPSPAHELVRNIVASPLAGLDGRGSLDVRPLAGALDAGLCADPSLAGLPGRFLFALDDGRGDVLALGADITAIPDGGPGGLALILAGQDCGVRVTIEDAVEGILAAAHAFLAERAAQGGAAWRLAELTEGPQRIAARLPEAAVSTVPPEAAVSTEPPSGTAGGGPAPGLSAQPDGAVTLTALVPLGRLSAEQLAVLRRAAGAGAGHVLVTPWRSVVVPGLPAAEAAGWAITLRGGGLVPDAGSPWTGVTACAGRPGCAKSLADVRADAAAAVAGSMSPMALPVHWIGCERGCGRPAGTFTEVRAIGSGEYEVTTPGHQSRATAAEVPRAIATADQPGTVAAADGPASAAVADQPPPAAVADQPPAAVTAATAAPGAR
jgi:precorrin-3B synthase